MHYIIYVSEADKPMSEAELEEILRVSRRNNEAAGITGLLIYKESSRDRHPSFIQLIEGERDAVDATYRRIIKDRRHHNKIPLEQGETPERQFAGWSMGFKNVTPQQLEEVPGFKDVGGESFDSEVFRTRVKSAVELMRFFYEND